MNHGIDRRAAERELFERKIKHRDEVVLPEWYRWADSQPEYLQVPRSMDQDKPGEVYVIGGGLPRMSGGKLTREQKKKAYAEAVRRGRAYPPPTKRDIGCIVLLCLGIIGVAVLFCFLVSIGVL